jgi:DNA polymerase
VATARASVKFKHFLFVDFETYYDQVFSLRNLSPPEYILSPQFQDILMAAYDPRWNAPKVFMPEEIPAFLTQYPAHETVCCSHNALFDLSILSWRYGWVAGRLQDTLGMARALRNFKKNSLGYVVKQLFGTDTKGDMLYKVKGMDAVAIKRAGLWSEYVSYALQDVRLCFLIYQTLSKEFPQEERKVMDLVLRAAVQPTLHADVPLLQDNLVELLQRKERILRECGYDKASLMSTAQFKKTLEEMGVEIESKTSPTGKWIPQFSKSDPFMAKLLEYDRSPDDDVNYQVQTLAMARLSHKSTIEETRAARFIKIASLPWGKKIGGKSPLFSGEIPPLNGTGTPENKGKTGDKPVYPLNGSRTELGAFTSHPADTSVNGSGIAAGLLPVALRYGGAHTHRLSGEWKLNMQNLPRDKTKSKLREALIAPPGQTMITADLAQIEARIVAVLTGQADLTEQFRRGEDVYATFATHVFHKVVTKQTYPHERFLGKTAILGLGYGCGHERYYQMVTAQARAAGIPLTGLFSEAIATTTVNTYRLMFPKIPAAWRRLDGYLSGYINSHNETQFASWGPVKFRSGQIILPNKLTLRYDHNDTHLYGAKLLENITQALARIVVMQAAVRLAERGLRFVLQAHDELVFLVQTYQVEESKAIIAEEMTRVPAWLPGVPLAVEVGSGANYGECK